jgi:hypothetical protein
MLAGGDRFRRFRRSGVIYGSSDHYSPLHTYHLHHTRLRAPYQTVRFRSMDVKNEVYTMKLVYNTLHVSWYCLYHPYGCPRMV